MNSTVASRETARQDANKLLQTVGVSRIVMVDDEYAAKVEDLLGICQELGSAGAAELPHLDDINPEDPDDLRNDTIRRVWITLDKTQRRRMLAKARQSYDALTPPATDGESGEGQATDDYKAASSLDEILHGLGDLEFVPLSLGEWEDQADRYLADDKAGETLLLFDQDFSAEQAGAENEGLKQIQKAQSADVGYCGLVTHTVTLQAEHEAWIRLSSQHNLIPDKFVVIAKERLKSDPPDYHGFLAMLRLAALSGRYGHVKSRAWSIFESSVNEAKSAMERLSVLDFDRMVFASSREESVWEPDTLLRVFGILMRRQARSRLHRDEEFLRAVETARRVSNAPDRIVKALKDFADSKEALEMQRFEIYESGDELNQFRTPIDLGDIFRIGPDNKLCILLAQPCDLVVRKEGMRSYETSKLRRMAAVAELVRDEERKRESWGQLPCYEEETGARAFVNFGKVHQVPLILLDLCAVNEDGWAALDVSAEAPAGLIKPWMLRYKKLRRIFRQALTTHAELTGAEINDEAASLALPGTLFTLDFVPVTNATTLRYEIKRTMRLRQPWSGALLTEFAQYQARAAFEHSFGHRDEDLAEPNGGRGPTVEGECGGP